MARKRRKFTEEELDMERTPIDFNNVPWRTDIRLIRERINKEKAERSKKKGKK